MAISHRARLVCVEGCPFICVLRSVVMVEDSESCGGCQSLSEHRLLASFDEWNVEKDNSATQRRHQNLNWLWSDFLKLTKNS